MVTLYYHYVMGIHACIYLQNEAYRKELEEAMEEMGINPVWIKACNEMCQESCTLHYNVAEICHGDTVFERVLGSGQYGTVLKGKVNLPKNIM